MKRTRRTVRDPGTGNHEDPAYSGEYGAPPRLPKRKRSKKR